MDFKNIIFGREGNIATIAMNRPENFNALNPALVKEVIKALEICWQDAEIRGVVLTGAGKAFCSGGDIGYFRSGPEGAPDEPFKEVLELLNRLILSIRQVPKPVIAAVNGVAAGAGVPLALSCDLRIASDRAKFKLAYTSLGLPPDGGSALLLGLTAGFSRACEMVFLDPVYDARQALDAGLVHRVVEAEKFEGAVRELAGQLAAGPTKALAIAKAGLNQAFLGLLERQLEIERRGVLEASLTEDYREGLAAFLEKRLPVFKGR